MDVELFSSDVCNVFSKIELLKCQVSCGQMAHFKDYLVRPGYVHGRGSLSTFSLAPRPQGLGARLVYFMIFILSTLPVRHWRGRHTQAKLTPSMVLSRNLGGLLIKSRWGQLFSALLARFTCLWRSMVLLCTKQRCLVLLKFP